MHVRAIWIAAGIVTALCACSISVPVTLYPVEGPYSEQKQKPIINATAHDVQRNTGKFEVTLPDGEICEGQWSSAAGVMHTQSSSSLFTQYGSVVGFGTSVSNVPGVNAGQAMSFCPSGRFIEAEFVTGSGTANGYGVAKDSDGNLYRMLF
jgi:hypothetical protein